MHTLMCLLGDCVFGCISCGWKACLLFEQLFRCLGEWLFFVFVFVLSQVSVLKLNFLSSVVASGIRYVFQIVIFKLKKVKPSLWPLRINFLESGTASEGLIKIIRIKHQFQCRQPHPSEAKLRVLNSSAPWGALLCVDSCGGHWAQVSGAHTSLGQEEHRCSTRGLGASMECYLGWEAMVWRLECDFGLIIVLSSQSQNFILIHLHSILKHYKWLYLWAFFAYWVTRCTG